MPSKLRFITRIIVAYRCSRAGRLCRPGMRKAHAKKARIRAEKTSFFLHKSRPFSFARERACRRISIVLIPSKSDYRNRSAARIPVSIQTRPLCHLERSRARGEAKLRNLKRWYMQAAIRFLGSVPLALHFTRDDRTAVRFRFSIRFWRTQVCSAFVPCSAGGVRGACPWRGGLKPAEASKRGGLGKGP